MECSAGFKQLQEQGHKIDKEGMVDGKYRIGMAEIPEDRIKVADNVKVM